MGPGWETADWNDRSEDAMDDTILIVDDEQPMRRMLYRLLDDAGYAVLEAESAESALDALSASPADLVITDLKMPGMDGLGLARELLTNDPDRPVLLMTAFADLDSARQAVKIGIYEYFTKPFDVNDVVAGVRRALERRRLVLEIRSYQQDLERKVAARTRDLQRAYGELVHTERFSAVGRLAAGVVHEVLNPLSVAIGRIDMALANGALDDSGRRCLDIAREQVGQAVRILNTMRDFSRQRPPKRAPVGLNALVAQTLEMVAYETTRRNIRVNTRLRDLSDVLADRGQISRVFLNLIDNAIDAMPEGGQLTVETRASRDGSAPIVEVCFADTGTGVPEADMPRIFEPFFTTREGGAGLGLPICRGIVEIHGGRIGVESRVGTGSVFTVRLPVKGGGGRVKGEGGRGKSEGGRVEGSGRMTVCE